MSLKKLIKDRSEAREDILANEVTATHTEKLQLLPHRAKVGSRNQRKRKRRACR